MLSTPLSTAEAEWFGATLAAINISFLAPLAEFLSVELRYPIIVLCDNKSACQLSESDLSSRKMRHVAMRLAYLQGLSDADYVALVHIFTEGELADIGTKIELAKLFHGFRKFLIY